MRSDQIKLIRKAIELISKNVFPEVNQISEKCAIAVGEAIKCLTQSLENKSLIDKHTKSSEEFAKSQEEFLKKIFQEIEEKDLFATIMLQTKHKNNNDRIDICMSTMTEEDDRILEAFRSFFIQAGTPQMFIKFLRMMMTEMGGKVRVIPIPMNGMIDPENLMSDFGGEKNESNSDLDDDER
jgi:hypothetical protein